ncbi:MAG: hypothetical protein ACFFDY_14380 [Candidatus Thorarchaeota archaeon]
MFLLKKKGYTVILLIFFYLQLISFTTPIRAQEQPPILEINSSFILTEYADDIGQNSNDTSVSIDIPLSTWNLSAISINFTSIKMGSETIIIEDDFESGFETIRRNDYEICGMQLNITEQTKIFAVEIFGWKYQRSYTPGPVYVRIEGWNSIDHIPNGTIYGEQIELNISHIPNWYKQTFNSPIELAPGYYCLVIDGSDANYLDRYYWYINNFNVNSSLYMCRYDDDVHDWQYRFGDVFLHKIERQVNRSYNPEDINMTAHINNDFYPVQNGGILGTGVFAVSNLNFCPESSNINIFISDNISVNLLLNYNYAISIYNSHIEKAIGSINQDSNIQWVLNPSITRFSYNHSMIFYFPKNWFNFSILRNSVNITSQISLNYTKKLLILPDATIINGATWKISASSPPIDFQLHVPKSTFGPQQDLQFSIQEPALPGNYTIFLYNSLGFSIENPPVVLQLPVGTNLYQYSLSANPEEGTYMVYVFWNNATDAGLKVYDFQIEVPFTIPIEILYGILIFVFSAIIISLSSYGLIKRTKRIKYERRLRIYNKYMDTLNIEYFLVSDKISGLSIYDQNIAGNDMEATFLSGFLQVIRTFGIELTKSRQESQTIKLEYQDSKILMSEFKDFRLVFIMKDSPSEGFIESVDLLSKEIDDQFGKNLENFDGNLAMFKDIRNILEKHLPIALIYPLKFEGNKNVKLSQNEKSIIERTVTIMKKKNQDHFYVANLLGKKSRFQVKDAEDILKLIKKSIFIPIFITPK